MQCCHYRTLCQENNWRWREILLKTLYLQTHRHMCIQKHRKPHTHTYIHHTTTQHMCKHKHTLTHTDTPASCWPLNGPISPLFLIPTQPGMRNCKMARVASVLGLVMLSVALLILSLISYVSLKKENIFTTPKYANPGAPRMYMFHAGFRCVRASERPQVSGLWGREVEGGGWCFGFSETLWAR